MDPKPRNSRFAVVLVAISCIAMLFSGCGFQPRGRADLSFDSIYVETNGFSLFGAELRRVVQAGSVVQVVESADEAEVILKVVSESQERHIIALTGTGSVREFQLVYKVAYRVMDNELKDLAAPGEIVLRRDMLFDDTLRLAKESEAEFLYRDMQTDAVHQMLRRLSVVLVDS
jgi:LPS-assembly lipoprotein